MQRRNATIRGPRHFLRSGPLKLITKNSRTVGGPYHQWGPPSLDAAATPSLRHGLWVTPLESGPACEGMITLCKLIEFQSGAVGLVARESDEWRLPGICRILRLIRFLTSFPSSADAYRMKDKLPPLRWTLDWRLRSSCITFMPFTAWVSRVGFRVSDGKIDWNRFELISVVDSVQSTVSLHC